MPIDVQRFSFGVPDHGRGCPRLLTWDGRLDNGAGLTRALGTIRGADTSNAALVLATYEHWGIDGLSRLVGDWSVVIEDPRQRRIVLASDYAGVRPLYYTVSGSTLAWSTRLAALVDAATTDAFDEEYVARFLTAGGCPDRTPYDGIRAVPPGHAVIVTTTSVTVCSLWTPPYTRAARYRDERDYDEQLRALFREAVAVRLAAPAPAIAELSGGLDSSSVVCMASELIAGGAVAATALSTASYEQCGSVDSRFIGQVQQFCGVTGAHLRVDALPLVDRLTVGEATPQVWGPLHRAAAQAAHQRGATVFLTGQGGDLMMGNWLDDSLQIAAPVRRGQLVRAAKDAFAWSKVTRTPAAWILARAAVAATLPATLTPEALYTGEAPVGVRSRETSLTRDLTSRAADWGGLCFRNEWRPAPPERRRHFRALASMRELRTLQRLEAVQDFDYTHPFAHRPLVEFVLSLPADVLCRPGEPRRLMRRALGRLWPPALRGRRSKSLFGGPWIAALRPLARELSIARHLEVVERGWVDRNSLRTRLERLMHGLDCNESQLRQIILLEFWLRNRIARSQTHPALHIA